MGSDPQIVQEAASGVIARAVSWLGVRSDVSTPGVIQLLIGRGVLARFHDDGLVEIPFPRPVGEKLVASGRAERHHALPDSGWVEVRLSATADVERVTELLRLAYEARRPQGAGPPGGGVPPDVAQHIEWHIDESGKESFPASDPPAHRE